MYEQYVQILRGCDFGKVREVDFIKGASTDISSYRMAKLEYDCPCEQAVRWAAVFTSIAVEVKGYLTMSFFNHSGEVRFSIMITTPIVEAAPCETQP